MWKVLRPHRSCVSPGRIQPTSQPCRTGSLHRKAGHIQWNFAQTRTGSRQPESGLVAGDGGLVDLVDLLGVEEFARVAQVHLVAHEDVEEVRVDVPAFL